MHIKITLYLTFALCSALVQGFDPRWCDWTIFFVLLQVTLSLFFLDSCGRSLPDLLPLSEPISSLYWSARRNCSLLLQSALPWSLVGALECASYLYSSFALILSEWAPWHKVTQQRQICTITLRQAYDVNSWKSHLNLRFQNTQVAQ